MDTLDAIVQFVCRRKRSKRSWSKESTTTALCWRGCPRYILYIKINEQHPGEGQTVFDMCCKVLNTYFQPRVNVAYERSAFRPMSQNTTETIEQFITRLRQKAVYCNFGDNIDEMIRDQVIKKCCSSRLRRKS